MRSVFWRIFACFWLAIILVAGSSILIGRLLNQDAWILSQYPATKNLAEHWTSIYENEGLETAKAFLHNHKKKYHMSVQVISEYDKNIIENSSISKKSHRIHKRMDRASPPPWRQLTEAYTSPQTGNTYLFIYRISHTELIKWHRTNLWLPISALIMTLIVLTLVSLLLTLLITTPLNRLRRAVKALGHTAYQKNSLANLANRKDEFGVLAKDFSLMGEHLQTLINSQRQLLRDVSHELRSPLTRLKITLALLERSSEQDRAKLIERLVLESDRLEILIAEILALARLDSIPCEKTSIELLPLLKKLLEDASINAPEQRIHLTVADHLTINAFPDRLEKILDNLIRNALRFSPKDQPIEISAWLENNKTHIRIRDHGVGVPEKYINQLTEPFFRVPGQTTQGYGLGLAITKKWIEGHNGKLFLSNHPEGGFMAEIIL